MKTDIKNSDFKKSAVTNDKNSYFWHQEMKQ